MQYIIEAPNTSRIQQGFTLIELMVVVAIVAIIAAVALPSYRQHVVKSNRSAAQSFMLTVANNEERLMLDARSYGAVAVNTDFPNTPIATPPGLNLTVPANVLNFYNFSVTTTSTPPAYTITATATGTQLTSDASCTPLTLTQTGAKTPASGCW